MKVKLYSDLHLEFFNQRDSLDYLTANPENVDVLILAGDIITTEKRHRNIYRNFFNEALNNHDKVIMVMGNHEHYGYNFDETQDKIQSLIPEEVSLLENDYISYSGVDFIGATMWTNFRNGNPLEMLAAEMNMNDYHIIRKSHSYRKLRAQDTYQTHIDTIDYFSQVIPILGDNVFVITHHAPSFQSTEQDYRDSDMNGAYASDLSDFIQNHPNIKHWVHGHVHCSNDYMINQCRVISNAHGYRHYLLNSQFSSNCIIEV